MLNRILVVEDEAISALHLESKLKSLGYESVGTAQSGEEAVEKAKSTSPDLVLMDIKLHGNMDGTQAGSKIQKELGVPIVYLTAFSDEDTLSKARETAPFGYLVKPVRESTLRSTIEMALEKHKLQKTLEESNRDLERFAYMAAHDLKAPSRQVQLFLTLILKELGMQLNDKALDFIKHAQEGASKMQALVDDLLAYSQLTHRSKPLQKVELSEVLTAVLNDLKPEIERTHAQISVEKMPHVRGNPIQLRRLFGNILSNAIKYNRNVPQVKIDCRTEKDRVTISIADNGIGIKKENSESIFDIFRRLNPESEFPGTGIGLASCKKIVEIHGGQIWVESQEGKGSTFHVTLPDGIYADEPIFQGSILLVADNAPDVQLFVGQMLLSNGAEVVVAKNSEEALQRVRERNDFDIILMDIQLPGSSLVETLEAIKKLGFMGPIIAFTNLGMNGDREHYRAAGFDDCVNKNEVVERIVSIVDEHQNKPERRTN